MTRAIAEGLFTTDAAPRLIGGRDRASGRIVFPCPAGDGFDAVALASRGTVWSWTVQRFRPKSPPYAGPADFTPYAMAYVELAGETIVEARLTGIALDAIRIGMAVELVLIPLDPGAPDSPLMHAFAPLHDSVLGAAS